jgi:hypothetical protein
MTASPTQFPVSVLAILSQVPVVLVISVRQDPPGPPRPFPHPPETFPARHSLIWLQVSVNLKYLHQLQLVEVIPNSSSRNSITNTINSKLWAVGQ